MTPTVVQWGLVYQRHSSDHTYDEVVAHLKSGAADHLSPDLEKPISKRLRSESTAAYSKGRQRFPLEVAKQTMTYAAQQVQQMVASWHGHPVSLIDGATFMMRPTDSLIAHYGVQTNQHGTNYWMVLRGVAHLISRLGLCKLPQRKIQRFEPRLVRPRPRPYRFLKGDRQQARREHLQQLQRAG